MGIYVIVHKGFLLLHNNQLKFTLFFYTVTSKIFRWNKYNITFIVLTAKEQI